MTGRPASRDGASAGRPFLQAGVLVTLLLDSAQPAKAGLPSSQQLARLVERVRLEPSPRAVCALGDRAFAQALHLSPPGMAPLAPGLLTWRRALERCRLMTPAELAEKRLFVLSDLRLSMLRAGTVRTLQACRRIQAPRWPASRDALLRAMVEHECVGTSPDEVDTSYAASLLDQARRLPATRSGREAFDQAEQVLVARDLLVPLQRRLRGRVSWLRFQPPAARAAARLDLMVDLCGLVRKHNGEEELTARRLHEAEERLDQALSLDDAAWEAQSSSLARAIVRPLRYQRAVLQHLVEQAYQARPTEWPSLRTRHLALLERLIVWTGEQDASLPPRAGLTSAHLLLDEINRPNTFRCRFGRQEEHRRITLLTRIVQGDAATANEVALMTRDAGKHKIALDQRSLMWLAGLVATCLAGQRLLGLLASHGLSRLGRAGRVADTTLRLLWCLVCLELTARWVLGTPRLFNALASDDDISARRSFVHDARRLHEDEDERCVHDPLLGWKLMTSLKDYVDYEHRQCTTSQGFRGTEEISRQHQPGKVRIMVLGDSYTMGAEQSNEETFCARMARSLPDCEVINAGVTGYGHDQMLLALKDLAPAYTPDVVLVGYAYIDEIRNVSRFTSAAKPRFELRDQNLVLTGQPVPSPSEVVYLESHSWGLPDLAEMLLARARGRDGGYARGETEAILVELAQVARRSGAFPAVAYLPIEDDLEEQMANLPRLKSSDRSFVQDLCARHGIALWESTPDILEAAQHGEARTRMRCPHHYTSSESRVVARSIATWLHQQGKVPHPPIQIP